MGNWAVQAPDGKIIGFPDNFTDADVTREMSKMYPASDSKASPSASDPSAPFQIPTVGFGPKQTIRPPQDYLAEGVGEAQRTGRPLQLQRPGVIQQAQAGYEGLGSKLQDEALQSTAKGDVPDWLNKLRAGAGAFGTGVAADLTGLVGQPFESGKNFALTALQMHPLGRIVTAPYFMYQGMKMVTQPPQPNEDQASYVQRGLLGLGMMHGGSMPLETDLPTQAGKRFGAEAEFNKAVARQTTKEAIEANGVGLYRKIRQTVQTHQEALKNQANQALQPVIDADKAQAGGQGSISTAGAVSEAAKLMAKEDINYTPKGKEAEVWKRLSGGASSLEDQTAQNLGYKDGAEARVKLGGAWDSIMKQAGVPVNESHITLEEAKGLRSDIGQIMSRPSSPVAGAFWARAYDQMTKGMSDRVTELDGNAKRFNAYNKLHTMAFELPEGAAADVWQDIQGKSADASIDPLNKFSTRNIKELTQQMRQTGNPQLAAQIEKSQRDARALTAAHAAVNGKFNASVYRLFSQNPKAAWPGLLAMFATKKILPFPMPQVAGALAGAWNMQRIALQDAGTVGVGLRSELKPEAFQTTTQPPDTDFSQGNLASQVAAAKKNKP